MAKNTINYNFTLPDKAEAYDINIVNLNTTKIDAQIKSNEDKIKEQLNNFSTKEDTFPLCYIAPELNVNVSNNNGYYGQQMNLSIFILFTAFANVDISFDAPFRPRSPI